MCPLENRRKWKYFCTLADDTEMDVRALDRIMHEIDFAAVDRPHVSVRQSVALLLLCARALVRWLCCVSNST